MEENSSQYKSIYFNFSPKVSDLKTIMYLVCCVNFQFFYFHIGYSVFSLVVLLVTLVAGLIFLLFTNTNYISFDDLFNVFVRTY